MTVLVTILSQHCIAFASDSFLTRPTRGGRLEVIESQASKLFRVESLRGIAGYCGLAEWGRWTVRDWLRGRARNPGHETAQAFAESLAEDLNGLMRAIPREQRGIGIHFGAYERVQGDWIPELFWITNWTDPPNQRVRDSGKVVARRESYGLAVQAGMPACDGLEAQRLAVGRWFAASGFQTYNNGDPELFHPVASGFGAALGVLQRRREMPLPTESDWRAWSHVVRAPVETMSKVIRELVPRGQRRIGGRTHDQLVSHRGEFHSRSDPRG